MIFDLKTQEPYASVLYQDETDVLLLGGHGEARVSADQFAEAVDFAEEGGFVWFAWPRYHAMQDPFEEDPAIRVRRGELARYAAANGGQVHTHIEPPKPASGPRKALDWAKATFGSPT